MDCKQSPPFLSFPAPQLKHTSIIPLRHRTLSKHKQHQLHPISATHLSNLCIPFTLLPTLLTKVFPVKQICSIKISTIYPTQNSSNESVNDQRTGHNSSRVHKNKKHNKRHCLPSQHQETDSLQLSPRCVQSFHSHQDTPDSGNQSDKIYYAPDSHNISTNDIISTITPPSRGTHSSPIHDSIPLKL